MVQFVKEGTITLAVVVETQHKVAKMLESFIVFRKTADETHKGVQFLKEDSERLKTLSKIRDALRVPPMVRFDTKTTQTCMNHVTKCLEGTGSWIWEHDAYKVGEHPRTRTYLTCSFYRAPGPLARPQPAP